MPVPTARPRPVDPPDRPVPRPLRVAVFGLGTVGTGVAWRIVDDAAHLAAACGRPVELVHAVVRDVGKARDLALPPGVLHGDVARAVDDPAVDVGVELIGGTDAAFDLVRGLLEAGKDVVTANKALLCERGDDLFALARRRGRSVGFEAAVAGGVPVVAGLSRSLAANRVTAIEAILNGTSNFLLTRMTATGCAYADALAEAQRRGYAEADPAMDVDGTDAAQKLAILARLAFGVRATPKEFPVAGIDGLDPADLRFAAELGHVVKLLAVARRVRSGDGEDAGIELHVTPTLVRADRPAARCDGAMNIVSVAGDLVGTAWWAGPGAGREPTASAVLADLVDAAVGRSRLTFAASPLGRDLPSPALRPPEEVARRYYLRFTVTDRPHVFADLADILGSAGISLASIIQHESDIGQGGEPSDDADRAVPVVVMTHRTTEGHVRRAADRWRHLQSLRAEVVVMPVAE